MYTINGQEVDFIKVNKSQNKINIQYYEKFDIVTAHISHIDKKLKEKNINATICKNLYHKYIGIFLEHIEDYIGVIHILEIPMNAYSVDKKNNFLLINIDKIPKYSNMSYIELIKKIENK